MRLRSGANLKDTSLKAISTLQAMHVIPEGTYKGFVQPLIEGKINLQITPDSVSWRYRTQQALDLAKAKRLKKKLNK